MAFGDQKGSLAGSALSITNPFSATGSVSVVPGDLIYTVVGEQTAATTTGVADNLGNGYAQLPSSGLGRVFATVVAVAGTLTSVNLTTTASTHDVAVSVVVIEGPFAALDANPSPVNDTTSPATCPATGILGQADEVIIAWGVASAVTGSISATSPNILVLDTAPSNNIHAVLGHQTVSSTSSVAPEFTFSVVTTGTWGTTSFKKQLSTPTPGSLRGSVSGGGTSIPVGGAMSAATGIVPVAIGDLIAVMSAELTTLSITGAVDSLGHTLTAQNAGTDAGAVAGRAFYKIATAGGLLSSVTGSGAASSDDYALAASVFSGPFTASPLDANPANGTDGTSPFACPPTGTLAQASELVVVGLALTRGQTDVAASSPNLLAVNAASAADDATNSVSAAIGYQIVSSTSSIAPEFTASGTISAAVQSTMSFKLASTGIQGSLTVTEAADTLSSAGTAKVQGSLTTTEAGDTLSSAGTAKVQGSLTITEAGDTLSSAGTVQIQGSLTTTEADDLILAEGHVGVPLNLGFLAVTEDDDTLSSAGTVQVQGSLTTIEADDVLSSSGTIQIQGSLSVVEDDDSLSSIVIAKAQGSLIAVEDDDTLSSSGLIIYRGSLDVTEDDDVLSSAGTAKIQGFLSVVEEDDTLISLNVVQVFGSLNVVESDDVLSSVAKARFPAAYVHILYDRISFSKASLDSISKSGVISEIVEL